VKKIRDVVATPSKRIYHSIIADYHLDTAICELVDNAIDNWIFLGRKSKLQIDINLDERRQTITVSDNSGGIKEEDIQLVISPGLSKNTGIDSSIGYFGVGSKRAVVALSEEIKIFSRFKNQKTILVIIDDDWIKDEDNWDVPVYETTHIDENSTLVELVKLRYHIDHEVIESLNEHLSNTYALFLEGNDLELSLNGTLITATTYESWSYPPGFEPKLFKGRLDFGTKGSVEVSILGGLVKSGDPSGGEYGAYFYCNGRLIDKAYKGEDVGYKQIRIGQPHPSVSLARAIINLSGPAQLMPWNSSKSGVNERHQTFLELRGHIDQVLFHFSQLSKKYSAGGGWETNVFKYKEGHVSEEVLTDIGKEVKLYLPPIPRVATHKYPDIIKAQNKLVAKEKPWVKGHYEAIIAVNELPRLKLEQNNRLSLLILDSTLEIAFKDFLINESGIVFSEARLATIMKNRSLVHAEIKKFIKLTPSTWQKVEYYYKMRGELVHKRISVNISDEDLKIFKETVQKILHKMFKLTFKA
jgi:hypothetical protein